MLLLIESAALIGHHVSFRSRRYQSFVLSRMSGLPGTDPFLFITVSGLLDGSKCLLTSLHGRPANSNASSLGSIQTHCRYCANNITHSHTSTRYLGIGLQLWSKHTPQALALISSVPIFSVIFIINVLISILVNQERLY